MFEMQLRWLYGIHSDNRLTPPATTAGRASAALPPSYATPSAALGSPPAALLPLQTDPPAGAGLANCMADTC